MNDVCSRTFIRSCPSSGQLSLCRYSCYTLHPYPLSQERERSVALEKKCQDMERKVLSLQAEIKGKDDKLIDNERVRKQVGNAEEILRSHYLLLPCNDDNVLVYCVFTANAHCRVLFLLS